MRRIRGVIGMALCWAAAWGVAGMTPRWLFGFNTDAPLPLVFGVLGFIAGLIFSGILVLTERRRTFDQMSLPRFAIWGAFGGVLLSAVFTRLASLTAMDVLMVTPTFAVACAVSAASSLALARRAERKELSDGGDLVVKLTNQEKQRLL